MKFPLLPVCLLFILIACSKDHDGVIDGAALPKQPQYLLGSWKSYSYYEGTGNGGEKIWTLTDGSTRITFGADSTYTNTSDPTYDHFMLQARGTDTILRVYAQGQQGRDTGNFFISINTNTLTLGSHLCIEGCGEKYVRLQ
jgi:hypothetical protein